MGSNPAQGNYSFPHKLSSVEFPVTFFQFSLNLDRESICDPPGGDTLLAQGIYLTMDSQSKPWRKYNNRLRRGIWTTDCMSENVVRPVIKPGSPDY